MRSNLSPSSLASPAPGQSDVRERFESATRRGNPRWLWPEITIADWEESTRSIAAVSHDILTGRSPPALSGDATALGIAAYVAGMGPLLGLWIEQRVLFADYSVRAIFRTHLQENRRRTGELGEHARAVIAALHRGGAEATVLKGMHTAFAYFPEPAARPMADIDLLVDPRDEAKARRTLLDQDYLPGRVNSCPRQQTWTKRGVEREPRSLHWVDRGDPWSIDLQLSLNRRPSAGSAVAELDRIKEIKNRSPWALDSQTAVLGQPLLTLYHACHASCDFSSLTLLRLIELALIVRKDHIAGLLSWDELIEAGLRAGALGQAYPALRLCEALVPGTVPNEVLAAARNRVPQRALRFIDRLQPSTAHQVMRCSIEERFMWLTSGWGLVRQLSHDLFLPGAGSSDEALAIYRRRAFRLARGGISR